jgi:type IV fimbrial biogenesis protein FimT
VNIPNKHQWFDKLVFISYKDSMKEKIQAGFTLIELLITAAILVIVLAFAVPSFESIIQNNRSVSLSNDLIGSLYLARSEAVKRGVSVSVCAAADTNYDSCGNDWSLGWIVFVNPDENSTLAGGTTEPIIRVHQLSSGNPSITPTPNTGVATYNNQGFAAAGTSNLSFAMNTQGCTGNHARNLNISVTGRITTTPVACP